VDVIAQALRRFFDQGTHPVLFTGAGVSARAGLPTWPQLIESLAAEIKSVDEITTIQMLECVAAGDYTLAVDYFRMSRKVLEGDKSKYLVRRLSKFNSDPIRPIAKLPFRSCLTSNFDRSIHEAVAKEKKGAARDYRYGDRSFRQVQWEEDLFIARIHGAVELPETMVLSESQFRALLLDDAYAELLAPFFLHRNVLFVGFSFYDPAVRHVFTELNKKFGAAPPGRHMVLLPRGIQQEFIQRANRLNIEVVEYDPLNDHAELWAGIEEFNAQPQSTRAARGVTKAVPFSSTKQFLAACYARARTHGSSTALRSAIVEGIISAMIQAVAPGAISRNDLLEKIRLTIGLKGSDAETLLDASIKSLTEAKLCRKLQGEAGVGVKLAWVGEVSDADSLEYAIGVLTTSLKNRANVQEGWQPPDSLDRPIGAFFGELVRRRGWDLGAAFAAGRAPENVAVEVLFGECLRDVPAFDKERLTRVAKSMFQHPSKEEAGVLAELGRISFAVELAFQSPHSALINDAILPKCIYFDASVLLPALVAGHPFSAIYLDAIGRLRNAASSSAIDLKLRVSTSYLNEIISHRTNALEYSRQVGNNFPAVALSDALYHGATSVNVYVGAYTNWIHRNERIGFEEFLGRFASYSTESELGTWLSKQGFEVVRAVKGPAYADLYGILERANADRFVRGKRPILIEHDATQLSMLHDEAQRWERTLFVTADRFLQQVVMDSKFYPLAEIMISHVGLVQLIDLLLGGMADDPAAFAELLWSARSSDRAQAVRAYLTARGLEQYDDAMAMAMPNVIEEFADRAEAELERVGADLDAEDPTKRAAGFGVLGSLEKDYFAGMSDAVTKLRRQLEGN
jgi:SIR2-like protein